MRENRRLRAVVTSAVATTALLLAAGGLAAAPAQADTSGWGNGTVGVPMQINVTNTLGCQSWTLQATYQNGVTSTSPTVYVDNLGNVTLYWTPPQAGLVTGATLMSSECTPVSLPAVIIGGITTTTTISAPNTVKVGSSTQITVYVNALAPSTYQSSGTVVVKDANGATITTMGLTPGPGTGQSYAYWRWTPTVAGTYVFQATFNPTSGSAAAGSVSAQDVIIATPSGNTISLTAPGTMTQGVPVTLVASVFPSTVQGSVGFTLNGAPISASVPIVNGQASFAWTPNVVGNVTLGASYTTNQGGSGSTTDPVVIVAGPVAADVITLTQPGWGVWAPNGTYNMGTGSSFTFLASTLSGAGVTMRNNGTCTTSGLTLNVVTGSGTCTLSVSSPGGNGYGPVTQNYIVNQVPGQQTATVAAPQSGRLTKGRTYVLESPAQVDTNAGQNISWKITKGKNSVCSLVYPKSGSVNLKLKKAGTCNVKGTAPGVPNMWAPYTVVRSYTVK
jgi:hypothetical protein